MRNYYDMLPTYEPVSPMLSSCMHCASAPEQDAYISSRLATQNKMWLLMSAILAYLASFVPFTRDSGGQYH